MLGFDLMGFYCVRYHEYARPMGFVLARYISPPAGGSTLASTLGVHWTPFKPIFSKSFVIANMRGRWDLNPRAPP